MSSHYLTWWRHQMETFSASLAICGGNSPFTGEFPAQRPVTRSFDVFLDLRLNKRLSKQWWGWWFETPSSPLWLHCNAHVRNDRDTWRTQYIPRNDEICSQFLFVVVCFRILPISSRVTSLYRGKQTEIYICNHSPTSLGRFVKEWSWNHTGVATCSVEALLQL